MSQPIKPIKNLYFRFIKDTPLDGGLTAQQVAHALSLEGFIDLVPHHSDSMLAHYRDTEKLRALTKLELETTINRCLVSYMFENGLQP